MSHMDEWDPNPSDGTLTTRRGLRRASRRRLQRRWRFAGCYALGLTVAIHALLPTTVLALPEGPSVVEGTATIEQTETTLTITASDNSIVEFSQFNIAPNESVIYVLPDVNASTLSRVTGGSASYIQGYLSINGTLFLINPAGITFAPTATVNAGGLIASTLQLQNADFLAGQYTFGAPNRTSLASVVNQGAIAVAEGSYAVLMGGAVSNTGTITAPLGEVVMAAGQMVTIGVSPDNSLVVAIDKAVAKEVLDAQGQPITTQLENTGTIAAESGRVVLTAESANNVFDLAVNQEGIIRADAVVVDETGAIEIVASGPVRSVGTMSAQAGRIRVESTKSDVSVGGEYLAKDGSVDVTAARDLTVVATTQTAGATTFQAKRDLKVQADLTTDSGNLTLAADADLDGVGSFWQSAGTTIATTTFGDITISASGESTLANVSSAGSLTLKQAGAPITYRQHPGSTVNTAGSITIQPGTTLDAATTVYQVGKDWINLGDFIAGQSAVWLTSSQPALIQGSTTFNDFGSTVPGKPIYFEALTLQTILGTTTFRGDFGNLLLLRSTVPGQQFSLMTNDQTFVRYTDFMDAWIRGPPLAPAHSKNSGNNLGIDFSLAGPVWTGSGGTTNWSDPFNWDGGFTPGQFDLVRFATGGQLSVVDPAFSGTIAGLALEAGYLGTVTLARTLTVTGSLTISSGTLSLNGHGLSVSGTFSNDGTLRLQGGESVTLAGGNDTDSGTWEYVGNGDGTVDLWTIKDFGATDYYNLLLNDTHATPDRFALGSDITITGDLTLAGGTLEAGSYTLTVSRNWALQGGSFDAGTSTVVFNDASQASQILGSTTFYNFTSTTPSKVLAFEAGSAQTILGTWTIRGAYGQHVKLVSTTPSSLVGTDPSKRWLVNPQGPIDVSYAWVEDSHNVNPVEITMIESTNRGNSIGWDPTGIWIGPADGLWSNTANWSGLGGATPGAGDDVVFENGPTGANTNSTVDASFGGTIGSLTTQSGYTGTITLGRSLTITTSSGRSGALTLGTGATISQGANTVVAESYSQSAGTFTGGSSNLTLNGTATITGGTMTLTSATTQVTSMTINAPGVVRMASNSVLNLTGSGTPLSGTGTLDVTTNTPNTVQYTGTATTDITAAGPLTAYHNLTLAPSGSGPMSEDGSLTLVDPENLLYAAVIDTTNGFAYFGTGTTPGRVVKVRLSDFTRVGALTLASGENDLRSAVIDPGAGFAYFGTYTSPGIVVKVRLSDFTRNAALTFNSGENLLVSAVIDPGAGFAYFGTYTSPGIVVKVRLSDFTRVGALTLNAGPPPSTAENILSSAVIDTTNGFAYFGTGQSPGKVVKINLATFTRVGALTLNAGENGLTSAVIDPGAGFAYFGTYTSPGIVVKVRLSDFTRNAALTLNAGEDSLSSAVIDPGAGFAYFGTDFVCWGSCGSTPPGIVVKVNLVGSVTMRLGTAASQTLTVNGNLTIGNGTNAVTVTAATYNPNILVAGNFTLNANSTWTKGSGTLTFNGTGNLTDSNATKQDLGNVVISNSSTRTLTTAVKMTGLTINSGNTFVLAGNTFAFSAFGSPDYWNLTIAGDASETFTPGGALDVDGVFTLTSGTFAQGANTMNVAGNFSLASGATFTKATGGQALTFDGTGNLSDSNATKQDLGNVVISNSSTRTLTTASTMTNLTINSGSTFSLAGNNFTFSASAAVNNSGTFRLVGNETLTNVSNLDIDSGTVVYEGVADSFATTYLIKDFGGTDYYNLRFSYAGDPLDADTFQPMSGLAVAGTFTIDGGIYDANGQTTTVTGLATIGGAGRITGYLASTATQTFNGGLTLSSGGSLTGSSGLLDVNGALTLNAATSFSQGTAALNVSGTLSIANGPVFTKATNGTALTFDGDGNLTDSNAAGSKVDLGNVVISNNSLRMVTSPGDTGVKMTSLTINSGSTFALENSVFEFSASAAVVNNGTFRLYATATLTNVTNLDTDSGTVEYNATGAALKDFGAADYYNLTLDSPGTFTLAGPLDVNGAFTMTLGTLDQGTNTMNVAGNFTIGVLAGFTKSSNNSALTFDGTGNLTDSTATKQDLGNVVISNSSTRTLTTAVKMTGLTINSGNTFVLAGNTFAFSASNLDTDSGTVEYVGDGAGGVANFTLKDFGSPDYFHLTIAGDASETFTPGGALDVNGVFTLTSGTFSQGANTMNVAGNFSLASGATFTKATGGQALTFDGTGNLSDSTATKQDLGNVVISNSSTRTLTTAVKMTGLTINSGSTFSLAGNTFAFSASAAVSNSGTFRLNGTETLTNVTNLDVDSGTVEYVGDGAGGTATFTLKDFGGTDYYNLTINSTAGDETFQLGGALDANGTLTITSGTLDVTGNNYAINVAGNWSNSGTFTARSGSVTLDGASQQILGSTTFYELIKTVTAADTLTFQAGTTQTITGANTLTLKGTAGALLSLRSSSPGTAWSIDPRGSRSVEYLDVQDSTNVNATQIDCLTGCVDSGRNSGWRFSLPAAAAAAADGGLGNDVVNDAVEIVDVFEPDLPELGDAEEPVIEPQAQAPQAQEPAQEEQAAAEAEAEEDLWEAFGTAEAAEGMTTEVTVFEGEVYMVCYSEKEGERKQEPCGTVKAGQKTAVKFNRSPEPLKRLAVLKQLRGQRQGFSLRRQQGPLSTAGRVLGFVLWQVLDVITNDNE
ncbi:MAG: filamentous hemagglutinin N-terminal domain-containing protein [Candidatus Omnitrophica bacterium]|nr:filamentous hemagglutinin N-terminal domain-containing protein [Candidatus Omnitrophota bacterium]